MVLLRGESLADYARPLMPQPTMGNGPWGEAIRYWLNHFKILQADLVRASKLPANTVSRAARGLDVTTKKLRVIAKAFGIPLDDVLLSPVRRLANDARRQEIQDAVLRALQQHDEQPHRTIQAIETARDEAFRSAEDVVAAEESVKPDEAMTAFRKKVKRPKTPPAAKKWAHRKSRRK